MGSNSKGGKLNIKGKPVLLLNADFSILVPITLKRAINLYAVGKVSFLKTKGEERIHPKLDVIGMPVVAQLLNYAKIPYREIPITRKNILLRDNYTCFPAGTNILMSDHSYKNIEDMVSGDTVLDAFGDIQNVVLNINKTESELIRFRSYGGEDLVCTKDHRIFSIKRENLILEKRKNRFGSSISLENLSKLNKNIIKEYAALDIQEGDVLVQPLIESCFSIKNGINTYDFLIDKGFRMLDGLLLDYHNKTTPVLFPFDKDSSFFMGLYLAEGSVNKKNPTVVNISLHEEESYLQQKVYDFCSIYDIKYYIYNQKNTKGMNIAICSAWLARLMESLFGRGCDKKTINNNIFKMGKENIVEFLRGWAYGDGCLYHEREDYINKTSITTTSKDAALLGRNLCYSIGIFPTIQKRKKKDGRKDVFLLNFMSEENKKIFQEISKFKKSNKRHIVEIEGKKYMLCPIYYKEKIEKETTVYDIEVEGSHTFIANRFAVHNCAYTGEPLSEKSASVDHIIPKSRPKSPGNTWTNMVTCSKGINNYKGDKTPEEAGLVLKYHPHKPTWPELILKCKKEWRDFLENMQ